MDTFCQHTYRHILKGYSFLFFQCEIKKLKVENQELQSCEFVSQGTQPAVLRLDSDNGES